MRLSTRHSAALFALVTTAATPATAAPVRFLATGDFGEGDAWQYRVGKAMQLVCDGAPQATDSAGSPRALPASGCDFVLGLGDNVYDIGIESANDVQLETKFEAPYRELARTWYMTLGNHDNSHDPVLQSGAIDTLGELLGPLGPVGEAVDDAVFDEVRGLGIGHWYESGNREVAYHDVDAACHADPVCAGGSRWHMPARFYQVARGEADDGGPLVEFFGLDTNTLMYFGVPFPPLAATLEEQISLAVERQEVWIRKELADSTARWKIAFGHHPYVSNGSHGNAGTYEGAPNTPISGVYVRHFYEQLVCGRVDLVVAGHDHDLQLLKPVGSCGKTRHVVSGAGAKSREFPTYGTFDESFFRVRNEVDYEQDRTRGFFWFGIDGDRMDVAVWHVYDAPPSAAPPGQTADDWKVAGVTRADPSGGPITETIWLRRAFATTFDRVD